MGVGEQIELPLASSAKSALAILNVKIENKPRQYDTPALTPQDERLVPEWRKQVARLGDTALANIAVQIADQNQPTTANYQASDGRWLYFVASRQLEYSRHSGFRNLHASFGQIALELGE